MRSVMATPTTTAALRNSWPPTFVCSGEAESGRRRSILPNPSFLRSGSASDGRRVRNYCGAVREAAETALAHVIGDKAEQASRNVPFRIFGGSLAFMARQNLAGLAFAFLSPLDSRLFGISSPSSLARHAGVRR